MLSVETIAALVGAIVGGVIGFVGSFIIAKYSNEWANGRLDRENRRKVMEEILSFINNA